MVSRAVSAGCWNGGIAGLWYSFVDRLAGSMGYLRRNPCCALGLPMLRSMCAASLVAQGRRKDSAARHECRALSAVFCLCLFVGVAVGADESVSPTNRVANADEPPLHLSAKDVSVEDVERLPNYSFKLSVATSASKSTIWRLWSDVENWKTYDTILQYSHLIDGAEFAVGAQGYVKAKGAPKTKFELIEVCAPDHFVERLKIPLYQAIELRRYFENDAAGKIVFTHEVNFRGSLRWLAHALLGNNFRHETVRVMTRLRDLAERQEMQEKEVQTKNDRRKNDRRKNDRRKKGKNKKQKQKQKKKQKKKKTKNPNRTHDTLWSGGLIRPMPIPLPEVTDDAVNEDQYGLLGHFSFGGSFALR